MTNTPLIFPTPLPLFSQAQDTARLTDYVNELINYINTIKYSAADPAGGSVRCDNLSDVTNVATLAVQSWAGFCGDGLHHCLRRGWRRRRSAGGQPAKEQQSF